MPQWGHGLRRCSSDTACVGKRMSVQVAVVSKPSRYNTLQADMGFRDLSIHYPNEAVSDACAPKR